MAESYQLSKNIPSFTHHKYKKESVKEAEMNWNPGLFFFKILQKACFPPKFTRSKLEEIAKEYTNQTKESLHVEELFSKDILREVLGIVHFSNSFCNALNDEDFSFVFEEKDMVFGKFLREKFLEPDYRKIRINEKDFNTIYDSYSLLFPKIPTKETLCQILKKDSASATLMFEWEDLQDSEIDFYDEEIFSQTAAYYWHELVSPEVQICIDNKNTALNDEHLGLNDVTSNAMKTLKNKLQHYLDVFGAETIFPEKLHKYLSHNDAVLFFKAAIDLILSDKDINCSLSDEKRKILSDLRLYHLHTDNYEAYYEHIKKCLDAVDFSNPFKIYQEVFFDNNQCCIEYLSQKTRGNVANLLYQIVQFAVEFPCLTDGIKLLLENPKNHFYIFYSLVAQIRDVPNLLPYFIDEAEYGLVFLLEIERLSFQQEINFNDLPKVIIPNEIWENCFDLYIQRIFPISAPAPNLPQIITDFFTTLIGRFIELIARTDRCRSEEIDAGKQLIFSYALRIGNCFSKVTDFFTSKQIPTHYKFTEIALAIIERNFPKELPSMENITERHSLQKKQLEYFWFAILIFNYLESLPSFADAEENLDKYQQFITDWLIFIIENENYSDKSFFEMVKQINFVPYFEYLQSKKIFNEIFKRIVASVKFPEKISSVVVEKDENGNEILHSSMDSETYRIENNPEKCYRNLLAILSFSAVKNESVFNENAFQSICDFFEHCFYDDKLKGYVDCFDSYTDEKYYSLLNNVVSFIEKIPQNLRKKIYTFISQYSNLETLLSIFNLVHDDEIRKILASEIQKKDLSNYDEKISTIDNWYKFLVDLLNSGIDEDATEKQVEKFVSAVEQNPHWKNDYSLRGQNLKLFLAYKKGNEDLFSEIARKNPSLTTENLLYKAYSDCEKDDYESAIRKFEHLKASKLESGLIPEIEFRLLYAKFRKLVTELRLDEKDGNLVVNLQDQERIGALIKEADALLVDIDEAPIYLKSLPIYVKIYLMYILGKYEKAIVTYTYYNKLLKYAEDFVIIEVKEKIIECYLKKNMLAAAYDIASEILSLKGSASLYEDKLKKLFDNYSDKEEIDFLKKQFKKILLLREHDAFKVLPKKINNHNDDIGQFICNVLYQSLRKIKEKIAAVSSLQSAKEDHITDLLQITFNSYMETIYGNQNLRDQSRRGVSPAKLNAGEVDLYFEVDNDDYIIESLRMHSSSCTDFKYLDDHEKKVFDYSVSKSLFFIVIYYQGKNFLTDKAKIFDHIKTGTISQFEQAYQGQKEDPVSSELLGTYGNNSLDVLRTSNENCTMYHIIVDFGAVQAIKAAQNTKKTKSKRNNKKGGV